MNFTSQICTSCSQSERLLALGLKKETADMSISTQSFDTDNGIKYSLIPYSECKYRIMYNIIPAWSLHRLIEIIPNKIKYKNDYYHLNISSDITEYIVDYVDPDDHYYNLLGKRHNNLFEGIISLIEWLIKEGYFNKEYLEK